MDNSIQGQGFIEGLASFLNEATVDANVSGGTLEIAVPTTNTGTLEATARWDAEHQRYKRHQLPARRTISTDSLSTVIIESSTITGGNLTSAGSAEIQGTGTSISMALRSRPGQPTLSIPLKLPGSPAT